MKKYKDKNGKLIKAGDTLYNPNDLLGYYTVIQDEKGNLFLGDFDSPLWKFKPSSFWESVENK